ncbi:hypothetical protein [Blautia stercoris]
MEILLDWYKSAVVFAPIGKPHKIPNKNAEAPKGVREKNRMPELFERYEKRFKQTRRN